MRVSFSEFMAPEFRQHYQRLEGYDRLAALSKRWIEIEARRKQAMAEEPAPVDPVAEAIRKAEADHPLPEPKRDRLHFRAVISRISSETGVRYADIISRSRVHRFVDARFKAMAAVYEECRDATGARLSTTAIGRIFGGRDHATVRNALIKAGAK